MRELVNIPCPAIVHPWWAAHFPVGFGVAISALLAFLYPILYDKQEATLRTKLGWILLVAMFTGVEFHSIHFDHTDNEQEQAYLQCQQLQRFDGIATELEGDIETNKQHFDATMEAEKGILSTAKKVGDLSLANLENISGGNSFGYAEPFSTGITSSTLMLHNNGSQILSGLKVTIERVTNGCAFESHTDCIPQYDRGMMQPLDLGTLGPHQRKPIPYLVDFNSDAGKTGLYFVRIDAQNGEAIEQIWFKRSAMHYGYVYRFNVIRRTEKPGKGHLRAGDDYFQVVKTVDWTEYSPSESPDGSHLYHRGQ